MIPGAPVRAVVNALRPPVLVGQCIAISVDPARGRGGQVVSCRARTTDEAVGRKPYRHKWWYYPGGWCDGHLYPALHFTESPDRERVDRILQVQREWEAMVAARRRNA